MIDFMAVGKKIQLYRKRLNLTQDDLASRLFVTRQALSKWENGSSIPTIDTIIDLSKILGISFEELLCLDDTIDIDENDIFRGHSRDYVISRMINKELNVNIANVFYQLSPSERIRVLKALKNDSSIANINDLRPRLTTGELKFLSLKENDLK